MKIGLIGAPGSGKTTLAHELRTVVGGWVVDGYTADVSQDFDWALGRHASYAGHIAVGLERHRNELEEAEYITCGTMIDTVTHMAVMTHLAPDRDDTRRLSGGLIVLGCMVEDMFDYDHVFYLPLAEVADDEYIGRLANGLEEALDIFGVKYTILDNPDTRLADALIVINGAKS